MVRLNGGGRLGDRPVTSIPNPAFKDHINSIVSRAQQRTSVPFRGFAT
jgi:hypothetical protein